MRHHHSPPFQELIDLHHRQFLLYQPLRQLVAVTVQQTLRLPMTIRAMQMNPLRNPT
ncbi:MAG: hypothetical protein ACLFRT_15020 [Actinomycetota bacterium]